MPQPTKKKRRTLTHRITRGVDPNKLLNHWLALDRRVVELSMRTYDIPQRDRLAIRAQQRHLHQALRELHLGPQSLPKTHSSGGRAAESFS